jgi:uncharacterized protein (TIGR03437 family)
MSASRRDRLEANLAGAAKRRVARWQRYAAATGSAMALATNASLSGLGAVMIDSPAAAAPPFAISQNEPLLRSVRLAMAARNSGLFAAAAALEGVQAAQSQVPVISPGGVVPLYSAVNIIQPGGWISIYGTNLAAGTATWNGDFPMSLGGTSVTINGKPAYLSFVSPGQINLQAPDDTATGVVPVVVTTSAGAATAAVALNPYSPAFELLDAHHVTAIIVRSNGLGAYGHGAYDILGPDGECFGYTTVGAQAGDLVELFGVGFGPTAPAVPAGKVFSGAAPITEPFTLYINNKVVTPLFVGMSSAGLYQVNLIVPPGLGQGDVPIEAWVTGSYSTQGNIFFSMQGGGFQGCVDTGDGSGDGGYGGDGGGDGGGNGDGGGDGGDGGDGGGGGDGGDGGDGG